MPQAQQRNQDQEAKQHQREMLIALIGEQVIRTRPSVR